MSNARYNLFPSKPAFILKGNAAWTWGQSHSSTDADINYHSPWPVPSSTTFEYNIGSHASLETHPEAGSYKYLKFTAPVEGYYEFGIQGNIRIMEDNDYHGLGMLKNSTATAGSGEPDHYFFQAQTSGVSTSNNYPYNGTILMYLDANDYAVPYARSAANIRMNANNWHLYGRLTA